MAEIKDTNYITIFGWMRTKLNLKGTQLLVYAAIYGFTQDGVNEYTANLQWLADFIGVKRLAVIRAVKELVEQGFIEKTDRNKTTGKTNAYTTTPLNIIIPDTEGTAATLPNNAAAPNVEGVYQKDTRGVSKRYTGVGQNDTPKYKNINNNIKERKKERINKKTNNSTDVDFSALSDEALLDWWDDFNSKPFEPTTETFEMIDRYNAEVKRRGQGREGWKGKIIVNEHGAIERMKSYDEVIGEWGFNFVVVSKIFEFIKHCNANNHFVTNAKLNDLCYRLSDIPDDKARLLSLDTAIRKGYYDIRESSII